MALPTTFTFFLLVEGAEIIVSRAARLMPASSKLVESFKDIKNPAIQHSNNYNI